MDINELKSNSGEWTATFCRSVMALLSSTYGITASVAEVRYVAAWYASVMFKPEDLALVVRDPLLRASAGYCQVAAETVPPVHSESEPRTFFQELTSLVNRYSLESKSNTPDFILAQFVADSMDAFNRATEERERWYGRRELNPKTGCAAELPGGR